MVLKLAKKKKNKEPAKPRNSGIKITSFADLFLDDENQPSKEEKTVKPVSNKKIPYDLSYPQQARYITDNDFLNCYNFIPLPPKECVRSKKEIGSLTGSIRCTITPRTDIFIPNTSITSCSSNENTGETVKDFFSYKNLEEEHQMIESNAPQHPVIPGSAVRGIVRSMYEIFTNSCMSALDFNKPLSSRGTSPFFPAVLKYTDGKWTLYNAEKCNIDQGLSSPYRICEDNKGIRYIKDDSGKPVYSYQKIKFSSRAGKNGSKVLTSISEDGKNEGYMVIGEPFIRKHNEFIFIPNFNKLISKKHDTLSEAIKRYNLIIHEFYNDSKINKTVPSIRNVSDFYKGRKINENPDDNTVIPVWYSEIKDKSGNIYTYLSPACIGREIFINNFLKFTHTYEPCQGENLCPCCKLFGMVGETNATGSRVRFSDAKFIGSSPKYSPITTLKELSAPKPTSMEVYTHIKDDDNNQGGFWNYDIFTPDKNTTLSAVENISINGRKMYYHHPACNNSDYYSYKPYNMISKNRKRLNTVRPLKGIETNKFEFNIFFENITENEIKMLLVVTSLLFNESDYLYKIGSGKPVGLGSIKITVEDVMLRKISFTESGISYTYKSADEYKHFYTYGNSEISKQQAEETVRNFLKEEKVIQSVFQEIKKMTWFNYTDKEHQPQYPTTQNNGSVFQWFSNNRKLGRNRGFEQVLDKSGVLRKNSRK